MIVETAQNKVIVEGVQSTNQFTMNLSAKAYQVLTDGIYKNKIKAIIRELSTNAVDAQIAAGNPNAQFLIHLPCVDEEYFYIRDFGTGLTDEQIINVYTRFFESTKENSNDFTGCLGLGSKTPLCYNSKSVTIESFINGKKLIYVCYIDSQNMPTYSKLLETETNEPNGLKLQLSVNSNDFMAFANEASKIYRFFSVKPKFIGTQISIQHPTNYTCDKFDLCSDLRQSYALMGNVAYPIEIQHEKLRKYSEVLNACFLFKFNIGEVEFSSSRESLQYTDKTVSAIINKIKEAIDHLKKENEQKVKSFKNFYEACKFFKEFKSNYEFRNLKSLITPDYKGKPVLDHVPLPRKYKDVIEDGKKKTVIDEDASIIALSFHYYGGSRIHNAYDTGTICFDEKMYYDDTNGKAVHARIKQYLKSNNIRQKIVLFKIDDLQKAIKLLDCSMDDFIPLSTLPKPVIVRQKQQGQRNKLGKVSVYAHNRMKTLLWTDVDIKTVTNPVYVIRSGYDILVNNITQDPRYNHEVKLAIQAGMTVISVTKTQENLVKNTIPSLEKWSQDYKNNLKSEAIKNKNDLAKLVALKEENIYPSYTLDGYEVIISDNLYPNTIKDLIKERENLHKKYDVLLNHLQCLGLYHDVIKTLTNDITLKKVEVRNIYQKYKKINIDQVLSNLLKGKNVSI